MTQTEKNPTLFDSNIILPLPPEQSDDLKFEMAIYARFMRYLRHVPNRRPEIKVLSAIQFTADMLDASDAHVGKVLVDLGLRAPRMAFPAEFLDYADSSFGRTDWAVGAPNNALQSLQNFWFKIGEDPFAGVKRQYSLLDEEIFAQC